MTEQAERELNEQADWDYQWMWMPVMPDSWGAVAKMINDYMQLPDGRVVYEERKLDETKEVPPTFLESISDILHGHLPRNRRITVPNEKEIILIKVLDGDGTTIVHTPFEPEVLSAFDGAKVVSIGRKLKQAMTKYNT